VAHLLLERGVILRLLLGHLRECAEQVPSQVAQVVELSLHKLLLVTPMLLKEGEQPVVLARINSLA
jgi:hypothetical protein